MITKKSRLQLATALCGAFIFGDAILQMLLLLYFRSSNNQARQLL